MAPDPKLSLDERIPWSEPAWVRTLSSPYYNDTHRQLRENVRAYVDKEILPHALEWEAKGTVPLEAAIKFSKSGIPFENVPAQYRPSYVPQLAGIPQDKQDAFHALIMTDEMSRVEGGVGIALGGASAIGAPPIVHYGTEQQKRQWLPGLFSRETNFCLGITEPGGGSDVANIATTATKTADGKFYVVNGAKKWITGAPWATHMTTAVRTGGPGLRGISVLVISLETPGVSREKIENSGQNAGGASFVDLEDVRVPVENLIGLENQGFPVIMKNFNKERYILAVGCNRKSRTCLAMAFAYSLRRETFGKKLIESQVIRRKLTEMAHRVEAHWAWLEQLAYHVSTSPEGWQSPDIASRIALLKIQGGQILELAAREAQQVFGGAGYQKGGPGATVEQISRDLRMSVVGGGSEEIISDLAVRQELGSMAKGKL
ncbi:Acyl-CoA dehydrogenase related to the alkylation response protein AidB [Geosmithia morbida]|uniref:Acyl-CoA dehydrogenase related to the alkylation response protein AidB n=1 Tax=Geosmithia morbida TaxID=1094350 RepID=A0A9P4YQY0_9HYPO|nr:Acyl-CoA dehydrogenase related to the alkylation response protein AidB [Geosmithia morbida]KAF4121491.1 Acyl-CoA dehydrogenase related to the alkylation response protein AidB [Geosmithia morbida]